ncbi:MAG: DNA-binding protein [Planctomycetes bacterium]|nr:DNA-binding protein [Planctomycetota bacterium]
MQYTSSDRIGRTFVISMQAGDYLLESVHDLIAKENIVNAVIVSGIATLDKCRLHMVMTTDYPPVEHFEEWDDTPLELASIQGIIADAQPHLHTVVSDHKQAYAGHLETGCRILYLAELVIVEVLDISLTRRLNDKNIYSLQGKDLPFKE